MENVNHFIFISEPNPLACVVSSSCSTKCKASRNLASLYSSRYFASTDWILRLATLTYSVKTDFEGSTVPQRCLALLSLVTSSRLVPIGIKNAPWITANNALVLDDGVYFLVKNYTASEQLDIPPFIKNTILAPALNKLFIIQLNNDDGAPFFL